MPKLEIEILEKEHQKRLAKIRWKYFTIADFLELVETKQKEFGPEGFEAWNAKFWSELDKDVSKYFSARGTEWLS